jgi:intraflagellar transport protein 52
MLAGPEQASEKDSNLPTIAFSVSKKELFTPSNGFKALQRRLRGQFKVVL